MPNVVEVRCPTGPQKLFTKLKLGETTARYVQPDNVIEFRCPDCTRTLRRIYGTPPNNDNYVYHRYNFLGELVETIGAIGEPPG